MNALVRCARLDDRTPVLELLRTEGLPLEGVAENFESFVVAESSGRIVGAAGLEFHGPYALVRSVVVAAASRGTGLGRTLTNYAVREAKSRRVIGVYLLTTTAEDFFRRIGFEPIAGRDGVPAPLKESVEFRGACPASAILMRHAPATQDSHLSLETLVARMDRLPMREELPHKFVRTGLVGNNQIRLMDLERGYEETGWCAKEHILYVLEGSLILYFDGETLELHAGDVANLPPGDRYRHRPEPAGERVRLLLIEPR